MKWTRKQPVETGYYWTKIYNSAVEILYLDDKGQVHEIEKHGTSPLSEYSLACEWYGPIQPPE